MSTMATATITSVSSTTSSSSPSCTTAVPDKYGYVPPGSCNANYGYYPQWEDNTAFAVCFGLTTVAHAVQAVVMKKSFCWVIVMGASWECLCFILRALGARDQQEMGYVVVSTLLFLLAPLWINAFIYMTVARLVHLIHPRRRIMSISAPWLAKCFVAADVMCFIIQAAGGVLMTDNSDEKADLGSKVYMAGIGVQLGSVLAFIVVHCRFYRVMVRALRSTRGACGKREGRNRWTMRLFWVVYLVLGLIIVRIIFRLIEFSGGVSTDNVVLRHEQFQLYLDAFPMLVALVALNVVHPGMVLKGPESAFPSVKLRWWRRSASDTVELSSTDGLDRGLV